MNQSKKIVLIISLILLIGAQTRIVLTDWESYNDESWQSQKPNTYSDESWSTKEWPCTRCSMKKFSPQTTFVGKKIAIRGEGFGNEPGEVIFSENVKAEIISWSFRRIWVLVPEGAITGTVKVVKNCPSGRFAVSQPIKIGNPTSD
jgi:hypothetical protein